MSKHHPVEQRERAVRMVLDHVGAESLRLDSTRNRRPNWVAAHGVTVQNMRETGRIRWLIDG
jgi:hypothetical protein